MIPLFLGCDELRAAQTLTDELIKLINSPELCQTSSLCCSLICRRLTEGMGAHLPPESEEGGVDV